MTSPPAFMELMSIARGFQSAKVLMVATSLGLFDHLEHPCTATEAAAMVKADPRAVGILLNALAAMGLVLKEGESFQNRELTARYLLHGKDDYRGAIIRHIEHTWPGWTELGRTVATGQAPDKKSEQWLDRNPWAQEDWTRDFIWGMHAIARDLAPQVAEKLDLPGVRRLLARDHGPPAQCGLRGPVRPRRAAFGARAGAPRPVAAQPAGLQALVRRSTLVGGSRRAAAHPVCSPGLAARVRSVVLVVISTLDSRSSDRSACFTCSDSL